MIVLYDSQIFGMQDYGGISRYYSELVSRLPSKDIEVVVPPMIHNNHYLKTSKLWSKDKHLCKFKYRNYLYSIVNFILQIPKILNNKYDIIHPTYYDFYYPRLFCRQKMVITVYDLIHERMRKNYPELSENLIIKKRRYVDRADKIIAISENTKKDLIDIYQVPANKIDVVYLGNSLSRWDNKSKIELPNNYILFVGQRWLYKNFINFLTAASKNIHENTDLYIVCAGGGKFTEKEQSLINKLDIAKRVIHVPFSSDRDLSEIYARSTIFVYPSLYEGFGIPILEAFASKTPIAISNTSCFPEIAGDAAVYFDPEKESSIYNAMKELIDDETLRKQLVVRGIKRLKYFSWDKAAEQTASVYKKVLEGR